MNKKRSDLDLNAYQKKLISEINKLELSDPTRPWRRTFVIPAAGSIATGWTLDDKVLLVSHDGYSVYDPADHREIASNLSHAPYDLIGKDNLTFFLREFNESIKIFGLFGGDGNHVTTEGWGLLTLYPGWPNSVIGLREPTLTNPQRPRDHWEGCRLIKLERLEYFDLKCGFSNDENRFLILGSGGVEIFSKI